jgi:HAE1 family hydrophobic/amphiphilic exporter-1
MNLLGFTVNMITMMALSLCVGLLIDDAIVVRENIVRHVQMGKSAFDAAMDGTREIGLAVFATTMSIVAVFLPIGFMGGIIGKFFHEFGLTIVAAVRSRCLSASRLIPMLSSIWHDPSIEAHGKHHRPVTFYDKTIGRVTALFDLGTDALVEVYQGILMWALAHKLSTLAIALAIFVGSVFMVPLLGTEFVPKSDFSETNLTFHTPVGSSLEVTEERARQVDAVIRSFPEVRYTLTTINTGNAAGKMYASIYIRLVDRKPSAAAASMTCRCCCAERLREVPGISVTHVGLLDPVGGQKQISFSIQGADMGELSRLTAWRWNASGRSLDWWTLTRRSSLTNPRWKSRCAAIWPRTWA